MGRSNICTSLKHKSASQMFGFALKLDQIDTWLGAAGVWKIRLTDRERAALAFAALKAQTPEDAAMTAEAVLGLNGSPLPPMISAMDEATFWAAWADPKCVRACVLAGYNSLPEKDQAAFLSHVSARAAA